MRSVYRGLLHHHGVDAVYRGHVDGHGGPHCVAEGGLEPPSPHRAIDLTVGAPAQRPTQVDQDPHGRLRPLLFPVSLRDRREAVLPEQTIRKWWALQESNLQPTDYESAALTIELRALNQENCAVLIIYLNIKASLLSEAGQIDRPIQLYVLSLLIGMARFCQVR